MQIEVVFPTLKSSRSAWYVEYQAFNPHTQILERFRVYKGFKKLHTVKERDEHAKRVIDNYTAKLRTGWRPWARNDVIYADATAYNTEAAIFGRKRKDSQAIRKCANDFLEQEADRGLAHKTKKTYISKIRIFLLWLEREGYAKLPPSQLSNAIVVQFFRHMQDIGRDRVTIRGYKRLLRAFFEYLRIKKVVVENPIYEIPLPKKQADAAARPMLDVDVERILARAAQTNQQFLLACLFQLFLCCRPNELRFIKVKDINLYNRQVYIAEESGKTGKRCIQMPIALVEACEQLGVYQHNREHYLFGASGVPGDQQLAINALGNMFRKLRDDLNLPKTYKFYSFKHTGAGKLLESGASIIEVMNQLGHSNMESTFHYIRRHFGDKSDKVDKFCPVNLASLMGTATKK